MIQWPIVQTANLDAERSKHSRIHLGCQPNCCRHVLPNGRRNISLTDSMESLKASLTALLASLNEPTTRILGLFAGSRSNDRLAKGELPIAKKRLGDSNASCLPLLPCSVCEPGPDQPEKMTPMQSGFNLAGCLNCRFAGRVALGTWAMPGAHRAHPVADQGQAFPANAARRSRGWRLAFGDSGLGVSGLCWF